MQWRVLFIIMNWIINCQIKKSGYESFWIEVMNLPNPMYDLLNNFQKAEFFKGAPFCDEQGRQGLAQK